MFCFLTHSDRADNYRSVSSVRDRWDFPPPPPPPPPLPGLGIRFRTWDLRSVPACVSGSDRGPVSRQFQYPANRGFVPYNCFVTVADILPSPCSRSLRHPIDHAVFDERTHYPVILLKRILVIVDRSRFHGLSVPQDVYSHRAVYSLRYEQQKRYRSSRFAILQNAGRHRFCAGQIPLCRNQVYNKASGQPASFIINDQQFLKNVSSIPFVSPFLDGLWKRKFPDMRIARRWAQWTHLIRESADSFA